MAREGYPVKIHEKHRHICFRPERDVSLETDYEVAAPPVKADVHQSPGEPSQQAADRLADEVEAEWARPSRYYQDLDK